MQACVRIPAQHVSIACLIAVALLLKGCGPSPKSTAPTPISKIENMNGYASSEDRLLPGDTHSTRDDRNLLANASFEVEDEVGVPLGWGVSPASIMVPSPGPEYDAFDGTSAITLQSVSESWGILFQDIKLKEDRGISTIFVSAQGRAPLPNYMRLSVLYKIDGIIHEEYAVWPACPDAWTSQSVQIEVPSKIDHSIVRVRAAIRDKPGFIFMVDDFRVMTR
jgi:hypothetical protein